MKKDLKFVCSELIKELELILKDNVLSVYLYGSCVLNDFRLGWSDIDVLVLTKTVIEDEILTKLLTLRQDLLKKQPDNKYFRSFEGAILPFDAFKNQTDSKVVYWGTKGEKIKSNYKLDSFSTKELIEDSVLLYGEDLRNQFVLPAFQNLKQDISYHLKTIREHAQTTDRNLYSFGWFLDISRCIYTLKTGKIISKTKAGKWALKNHMCPDEKALKIALKVRKRPIKYKNNTKVMDYAETLGKSVQQYANIIEQYLN